MLVLIHKTASPKVPVSFHPLPPQIFQFPDVYFFPFPAKSTCQSKYTLHCRGWQSSQYWSCLFILFIYTYIYVFFSPLQNECSDDLLMLRRSFNNKCADSVKVFGDTFFLLGENVSLEEIRISAILMTKHVRRLKKLMKLHIIPALSKKHIIHQLL